MPRPQTTPVSLVEALGLSPLSLAARQLLMVVRGDAHTPKSRFDVTSLKIFKPRLSLQTWLGKTPHGRDIPILNFVNRTPTPVEQGWSVRKTQARDWRGGTLTYDSHNGTDFIVPPGTSLCAAAPGVVRQVRREFHRGGLKLYVDHGGTLFTTYNHCARSLVSVGQQVKRGQVIALSGSSGADSTFMFPWSAPHLHFNVFYGGVAVDPYAASDDEVSLWLHRNDPWPATSDEEEDDAAADAFDEDGNARARAAVVDERVAVAVDAEGDVQQKGAALLIESVTYPTHFRVPEAGRLLFDIVPKKTPRLTLPFRRDDYDRAIVVD